MSRSNRRARRKWTRRLIKWGIGFAIGWAVERAVGTVPLLVGLFVISYLAFLLRMRKAQRWSLDQLWGQVRDMVVFATLPPLLLIAWDRLKVWLGHPSGMSPWEIAWPLAVAALIVVAAYDAFSLLPRRWR